MSNGNPFVFEFLHRCRHPDLHVRLRALDDLEVSRSGLPVV